jgi:hypothetical protein
MKSILVVSSVLGFAFAITACAGPDCEKLCEKKNACEGATQFECASYCSDNDALSRASACSSKWDDVLECSDANVDKLCDTPGPCDTEGEAWFTCYTTFCTANPTDAVCQ